MIIDVHSHMINKEFDLKKHKHNFTTKMFFLKLQVQNYEQYYNKISSSLSESVVDKTVLCALENTWTCSNNEQTAEICKSNDNFLYGANLDLNSVDVFSQLDLAIQNKAVLIKILPSYQNINLNEKKHIPFFEKLKENNLPLLVHTGIEHTIKGGNQDLNSPQKLETALKVGVRVIAAHLGAKLNFWEKDYFDDWCKLASKYENLYGDLSAFIPFYRSKLLKRILKDNFIQSKLIFGTDFPSYPFPYINKHESNDNIFNDWYYLFRDMGFDDEIFYRAEKILKI